MSIRTCAIFALSIFAIARLVSAQEPTRAELQQRLTELQTRLATLESSQTQATISDQTIARMVEDAERRSQFMAATGLLAGYDKGFFIKSDDDAFLFRPSVQTQFRYIVNSTEGSDDGYNTESGFEIRRLRLRFDGNIFTRDLTYSVVFDTLRTDGSTSLLDAWAAYRFAPKWNLKLGQFKESVFHEKDVSFTNQLAVERSLVDAVLGGNQTDRVQGVSLTYGGGKDDAIRAEVTASDGANSKNTDFQDTPTGNFGFAGRFEFKAAGDWSNYRDFTANGTKEMLLVFGAGADFTQAGDTDTIRSTIDAQWENAGGLGLYGALHANFTESNDAADIFDWGALVQAGYCVTKNIELFGRYDIVVLDNETALGEDTFNEFTVGGNYFFGDNGSYLHRAKFSLDFVYLPNGAPSNQTGSGELAGSENQFVMRAQFQLQI